MENYNRTEQYLDIRTKQLLEFCDKSEKIYIYGAGTYARYCYEVLKRCGNKIEGFITTYGEINNYCGEKVFCVKDIDNRTATCTIGIIPGFKGYQTEEITRCFTKINPTVFEWNVNEAFAMFLRPFLPILSDKMGIMESSKRSNHKEWRSILIIRLDALGDVVCTTPIIREVNKNCPNANIDVIVQKNSKILLEKSPYIDRLLPFSGSVYDSTLADDISDIDSIEEKVRDFIDKNDMGGFYDAIFLPMSILGGRNAVESIVLSYLCKTRNRYGVAVGLDNVTKHEFLSLRKCFTELAFLNQPMHESDFSLALLDSINLNISNRDIEVWSKDNPDVEEKISCLKSKCNKIRMAVGIVASSEERNWDVALYKELFCKVTELWGNKVQFILLGGKDASQEGKQLEKMDNVINATGIYSLRDSVSIISRCNCYLGSNTGLMHIAVAKRIPCITLYPLPESKSQGFGIGSVRWGVKSKNLQHIDIFPPEGRKGINYIQSDTVITAIQDLFEELGVQPN